MNEDILSEFDQNIEVYLAFTKKIEHLVIEILEDNKINYHSVTSRVKTRESFCKKLNKANDKYKCIDDITDVSGIRIVTYFEDDVDKIANIIEKEFLVDVNNSIDKRALLDPDRFGYLSLHHVVGLTPERCKLTEYKRFPTFKAEIQTRSILQHAWAEIEHDLGYKSKQGIPKNIRRSFSRLAGILELADEGFMSIRDDLVKYEREVPMEIEKNPELVTIDNVSFSSFVKSNKVIKEIDKKIRAFCGAKVDQTKYTDSLVDRLYYFDIVTISDLEQMINKYKNKIINFAEMWLSGSKYDCLMPGIGIFYLFYVLLAETKSIQEIESYLEKNNIGNVGDKSIIAKNIVETYNAA